MTNTIPSFALTNEQAMVGLSAMKMVAAANGEFAQEERALIEAAAGALGMTVDIDRLEAIDPSRAKSAFPDELWRRRLVQSMIAMACIDGEATKEELTLIESFRDALGVEEPWVKNLARVIDGHLLALRIDMARRVPVARAVFGEMWEKEGLRGVWKLIQTFRKKHEEPALGWKYKKLGLLPEGTFGREYWSHMTAREFALPGEKGGLLEIQNHHDLTHVLTGYDTDPEGEAQIAAFYAGYKKEDPFSFIFMVLVMFQLGIKIAPADVTPAKMKVDPHKLVRAMQRGAAIRIDFTDHWDYWPLLELPIEEVRRRTHVLP